MSDPEGALYDLWAQQQVLRTNEREFASKRTFQTSRDQGRVKNAGFTTSSVTTQVAHKRVNTRGRPPNKVPHAQQRTPTQKNSNYIVQKPIPFLSFLHVKGCQQNYNGYCRQNIHINWQCVWRTEREPLLHALKGGQ